MIPDLARLDICSRSWLGWYFFGGQLLAAGERSSGELVRVRRLVWRASRRRAWWPGLSSQWSSSQSECVDLTSGSVNDCS